MAYDAPTPATLKARFPAFAGVDDAVLQGALTEAAGRVDTTWLERDFATAQMLYAAHVLTMDGLGTSNEAKLGGFKSLTIGSLSLQRDDSATAAGSLQSTSYGRRFAELRRLNFAGPVVI